MFSNSFHESLLRNRKIDKMDNATSLIFTKIVKMLKIQFSQIPRTMILGQKCNLHPHLVYESWARLPDIINCSYAEVFKCSSKRDRVKTTVQNKLIALSSVKVISGKIKIYVRREKFVRALTNFSNIRCFKKVKNWKIGKMYICRKASKLSRKEKQFTSYATHVP